jgi:hypothetical protein
VLGFTPTLGQSGVVTKMEIKFHVHTDASNFVLGVMLSQNLYNTIDKPIYYVSRFMNNAKKLYNN